MYGYLFKIDGGIIDQINVNNFRLNKNIRIYKPEEIGEALAAMRKDVLNISYEAAMEDKVPNRANIEFLLKTNQERPYYYNNSLPYYLEFKNLDAFLASHGYLNELFVNPEDISTIIVKRAESNEAVEVKEKNQINLLLNMGNLGSENDIIARQKQSPIRQIFYYGKVVKENGQTFFVVFDTNPYFEQLITKMIQEK